MLVSVEFSKICRKLVLKKHFSGKTQVMEMDAASGGWPNARALPKGAWTIAENPSGDRSYFALFYHDGNINDQFLDNNKWRDGIRLGYHHSRYQGSHGCIMTQNSDRQTIEEGRKVWGKIQELIRSRPSRIIAYKNNENPWRRDNAKYNLRSYGTLKVID